MGTVNKLTSTVLFVTGVCVALLFLSPYLSLPIRSPFVLAQAQKQANASNNTGIFSGPMTENNTKVLMNATNIGNSNSTLFKGMEKSQLGNEIPGNQGTTFEGQQLSNLSGNSSG
jgi:hypothetical protein